MHSTVPSQIASFGWSIIPAGRTSQKRLEQGPWIDFFPSPHHQTTPPLYLLPLAHSPTMSYIGWVQAGGAWVLRVLPFQICLRVCLLLMCLPQPGDSSSAFPDPSCGLFLWFPSPFRSWASYDDGLYISLAHLWFSLLPATLNFHSCRNNLILLDLFLGQPFIPFLSSLSWALFCFYSWAPMSLWDFPLGIHDPIAFFGLPRPVC